MKILLAPDDRSRFKVAYGDVAQGFEQGLVVASRIERQVDLGWSFGRGVFKRLRGFLGDIPVLRILVVRPLLAPFRGSSAVLGTEGRALAA